MISVFDRATGDADKRDMGRIPHCCWAHHMAPSLGKGRCITATTATILLIVAAAAVIVGFDVLDVFGERLADSFQPLLFVRHCPEELGSSRRGRSLTLTALIEATPLSERRDRTCHLPREITAEPLATATPRPMSYPAHTATSLWDRGIVGGLHHGRLVLGW